MNRDELIAKYGGPTKSPEKAALAVADGTASDQINPGDPESWPLSFLVLVGISRSGELKTKA